jgi:hypothetical protein
MEIRNWVFILFRSSIAINDILQTGTIMQLVGRIADYSALVEIK